MSADEARFQALWARLTRLDNAEWNEFYRLVYTLLERVHVVLPDHLSNTKPDTINEFLAERVVMNAPKLAQKSGSFGYLVRMYQNYIKDQIRQAHAPDKKASLDDGHGLAEPDRRAVEERIEIQQAHARGMEQLGAIITEHGLEAAQVAEAAHGFLQADPPWQHLAPERGWIQLYLARHHCAQDMALAALARAFDIPAYHHKARKLGITYTKGGFPDLDAFRQTYLGQWCEHLGIDLSDAEAPEVVRAALKILCEIALTEKAL